MYKVIMLCTLLAMPGFVNADTYPAAETDQWIYDAGDLGPKSSPSELCAFMNGNPPSLRDRYTLGSNGISCAYAYYANGVTLTYFVDNNNKLTNYPLYTCSYGGTLSGTDCINAPACPNTQTRDATTGMCELPAIIAIKNVGSIPLGSCAGNPINIGTGNKYQPETDYQGAGSFPLTFIRTYNSDPSTISVRLGTGSGWRHNYERSIANTTNSSLVTAYRADGRGYDFTLVGNNWLPAADVNLQLSNNAVTHIWSLTAEDHSIETYNANGVLQSITSRTGIAQTLAYDANGLLKTVTHSSGRRLTLGYDSYNRVATLQDPQGSQYSYAYANAAGNLISVTYPDQTVRGYLYNEPANVAVNTPNALTGIIDEKGQRFATFQYDAQHRAVSSQHAVGVEYIGVAYGANGNAVTDALGTTRTSQFQTVQGVVKSTGSDQPAGAGCNAAAGAVSYDANGNIATRKDFNGNLSCYAYDLTRNLETTRIEGLTAGACPADLAAYTPAGAERKTSSQWNANYRLPTQITDAMQSIAFSYDSQGNLTQKTITDVVTQQMHSWSYTYNSLGQALSIDGPRTDVSDVTTFTYNATNDLNSVTDALGHTTQITGYNTNGQPLTIINPNGLLTTLQYNLRGKLVSSTTGTQITSYSYDATQELTQITLPDASALAYHYDIAHRLVGITDTLGNTINYTLDNMDNRLSAQVSDASNTLVKKQAQAFDNLSRLAQSIGAQNQTTHISYDANGNTTSVSDPLGNTTTIAYDSLNRLVNSIDPMGSATSVNHDSHDNPLSVIDPLNHQTDYGYDGFNNRVTVSSPDSGQSQTNFDASGNATSKTDALGKVVNYTYDALNRVTQINTSNTPVSFAYDQGANGVGHLTNMTDASGTTNWLYNAQGQLISKSLSTGTLVFSTHYAYNANGQLIKMTYPSGKIVQLSYNSNGQIVSLSEGGLPLVSGITYQPFGAAGNWLFGNGVATARNFDLDGRMVAYDLGNRSRQLSYDAAGRIIAYTDTNLNYDQGFAYDAASRLTGFTDAIAQMGYGYDANGNRTEETNGLHVKNFNTDGAGNKLLSITNAKLQPVKTFSYDAAGRLLSNGQTSFSYDDRGRMVQASNIAMGVEQYTVNGLGQRTSKINSNAGTYFSYDEAGHLIGEYNQAGGAIHETVWLGDMPVAVVKGKKHYFVHTDHLNAPRAISDAGGVVVWTWDSDPFGADIADKSGAALFDKGVNEDPDQDGVNFVYNLRLPGQYFDKGAKLNHNGFRDYDPKLGRYVESDPIGLWGGLNPYTYVSNNPLRYIDPLGLEQFGIGIESPSAKAIANGVLDPSIDPGHTFAYLATDSGNIISVYSMGPAHTVAFNKESFLNGTLGGVSDWPLNGKINTYNWKISGDQLGQCKSAFDAKKANPGNYSPTNQCTSSAISLANQCGINVPSGVSPVAIPAIPYVFDGYSNNLPNPYGLQQQLNQSMTPVVIPSSKFPAGGQ